MAVVMIAGCAERVLVPKMPLALVLVTVMMPRNVATSAVEASGRRTVHQTAFLAVNRDVCLGWCSVSAVTEPVAG